MHLYGWCLYPQQDNSPCKNTCANQPRLDLTAKGSCSCLRACWANWKVSSWQARDRLSYLQALRWDKDAHVHIQQHIAAEFAGILHIDHTKTNTVDSKKLCFCGTKNVQNSMTMASTHQQLQRLLQRLLQQGGRWVHGLRRSVLPLAILRALFRVTRLDRARKSACTRRCHSYMYVCVCVCTYICMYVCIYIYIYIYMYICVYIYIYIYLCPWGKTSDPDTHKNTHTHSHTQDPCTKRHTHTHTHTGHLNTNRYILWPQEMSTSGWPVRWCESSPES